MLNILFSTTRQWNPGDEFILMGCLNALRAAGLDFNPVIFNRNPQIRRAKRFDPVALLQRQFGEGRRQAFLDNSFKDSMSLDWIDLVVFAGSPEWRGRRLAPLYEALARSGTPTAFLGLGTVKPFRFDGEHFSEAETTVLKAARMIACRDALTTSSLAPLPARQMICPALLSAPYERRREGVRRIALIYGHPLAARHNNVAEGTHAFLVALYRALIERLGTRHEFEFVAHYVDEVPLFERDFPGATIRYSYDARDYVELYDRYDLVVGHRVHGVGMSASLGVPGFCVGHDRRGETARGFGAEMIQVGEPVEGVVARVEQAIAEVGERSAALLERKARLRADYVEALRAAGIDRLG